MSWPKAISSSIPVLSRARARARVRACVRACLCVRLQWLLFRACMKPHKNSMKLLFLARTILFRVCAMLHYFLCCYFACL